MNPKRTLDLNLAANRFGFSFWALWVLANTVGWVVGMSLAWLISELVMPLVSGNSLVIFWAIAGMLVGVNFGINHWFLFRPLSLDILDRRTHYWVIATILGWGISLVIVIGLGAGAMIGYPMIGLVIGLSVGIPQALVLKVNVNRIWVWPLMHTLAWTAGLSIVNLLNDGISFVLVGVVSGAICGAALIWLQRQHVRAVEQSPQAV